MLTAIRRVEDAHYGGHAFSQWLCKCDCGNVRKVTLNALRQGNTKSCGCLREKRDKELGERFKTHGESRSRLYIVWKQIKKRCYNPHDTVYKYYGGKGVTACDEWKNSYISFAEWAMKNGYNPNAKRGECTLDRINPYLGYSPGNCRWTTMEEQFKNTRREWSKNEDMDRHQGKASGN